MIMDGDAEFRAIFDDLENCCEDKIQNVAEVGGGWLNRKWRADMRSGRSYLVKQYSPLRFDLKKLGDISTAISIQQKLSQRGVCCPRVVMTEGQGVRYISCGRKNAAYMAMDFVNGRNICSDEISERQMWSLGVQCAIMKREFARLPCDSLKGYEMSGAEMLASVKEHYEKLKASESNAPLGLLRAVDVGCDITAALDAGFFNSFVKCAAHEDFNSENILFERDEVSAIVDFDRACCAFMLHDIGRALLSFTFRGGKLDSSLASAFCGGYRCYMPLDIADITDALRITWCVESSWWITPELFRVCRGRIERFRDEILWVGANWDALDNIAHGL